MRPMWRGGRRGRRGPQSGVEGRGQDDAGREGCHILGRRGDGPARTCPAPATRRPRPRGRSSEPRTVVCTPNTTSTRRADLPASPRGGAVAAIRAPVDARSPGIVPGEPYDVRSAGRLEMPAGTWTEPQLQGPPAPPTSEWRSPRGAVKELPGQNPRRHASLELWLSRSEGAHSGFSLRLLSKTPSRHPRTAGAPLEGVRSFVELTPASCPDISGHPWPSRSEEASVPVQVGLTPGCFRTLGTLGTFGKRIG